MQQIDVGSLFLVELVEQSCWFDGIKSVNVFSGFGFNFCGEDTSNLLFY